jgi:hypothetical protein
MVNLKIIMPFSPDGVALDQWLDQKENRDKIAGMNILYIIQKLQDERRLTKFGISERNSRGRGRLNDYVMYHGRVNKTYPHQGVLLFAVFGTIADKHGYVGTSTVRQAERRLIATYHDAIIAEGRGYETIQRTPFEVFKTVQEQNRLFAPKTSNPYYANGRAVRSRQAPDRYTGGGLYLGKTPRDLVDRLAEERETGSTFSFPSEDDHDRGEFYYWYTPGAHV